MCRAFPGTCTELVECVRGLQQRNRKNTVYKSRLWSRIFPAVFLQAMVSLPIMSYEAAVITLRTSLRRNASQAASQAICFNIFYSRFSSAHSAEREASYPVLLVLSRVEVRHIFQPDYRKKYRGRQAGEIQGGENRKYSKWIRWYVLNLHWACRMCVASGMKIIAVITEPLAVQCILRYLENKGLPPYHKQKAQPPPKKQKISA